MQIRRTVLRWSSVVSVLAALSAFAANPSSPKDSSTVTVQAFRFTGGSEREDSMWSALYAAKSGKLYIGLSTHAEAAHFFEFDPATEKMHHIADLTEFKGERGQGIRTTGKIHVRMSEDDQGRILFGDFCEDSGPECVDPSSYRGPHWLRYDPKQQKLEILGQINRQWGLLGFTRDAKRQRLYGLGEDGHLYTFDERKKMTTDLGRVDDWDICRTIFSDDEGNVFGSFPIGRIWKYDPQQDRIFDLRATRLPLDPRATPRTMSNPLIDRKVYWRVIEWDPVDRVAYGIVVGDSLLFKFDTHDGPAGTITPLVRMCAERYLQADPSLIPVSTLALTISDRHRIYYAPVISVAFDYSGVSWDVADERAYTARLTGKKVSPESVLVAYDIASGKRRALGIMRTADGRQVWTGSYILSARSRSATQRAQSTRSTTSGPTAWAWSAIRPPRTKWRRRPNEKTAPIDHRHLAGHAPRRAGPEVDQPAVRCPPARLPHARLSRRRRDRGG
ncbi:MAG: hypothetical protein NTY53_18315 [Kiritimatiellaeota bacterium]|nr:hypothetical protein [Kiritimatiellota bacterium]